MKASHIPYEEGQRRWGTYLKLPSHLQTGLKSSLSCFLTLLPLSHMAPFPTLVISPTLVLSHKYLAAAYFHADHGFSYFSDS